MIICVHWNDGKMLYIPHITIYRFETGNDLIKINELKFAHVKLDC